MDFRQRQTFLSPPLPLTGSFFLQEKRTVKEPKNIAAKQQKGASDTLHCRKGVGTSNLKVTSLDHTSRTFQARLVHTCFQQNSTMDISQIEPLSHKIRTKNGAASSWYKVRGSLRQLLTRRSPNMDISQIETLS